MSWNKTRFVILFFIGALFIVIGLFLIFYPNYTISNLEHELSKTISQEYRDMVNGSLNWWKLNNSSFFIPIAQMALITGVLFIIFSITYSLFEIWHLSKNQLENQIIKNNEVVNENNNVSKIQEVSKRKTGFPIAAGILIIIASCLIAIVGFIQVGVVTASLFSKYFWVSIWDLFLGIFNIISFAFGLTAGIFSLKRKNLAFCIIGVTFTLVAGIITLIGLGLTGLSTWNLALVISIPIIIMSILGLIFDSVARGEF